jgi:hypothetical protein
MMSFFFSQEAAPQAWACIVLTFLHSSPMFGEMKGKDEEKKSVNQSD